MSKGSRQRPVNRDRFNTNFDAIFGKKGRKTPSKSAKKRSVNHEESGIKRPS